MITIQIPGYTEDQLALQVRRQPKRFPVTLTVVGKMSRLVAADVIRMAARKAACDLLKEPLPHTVTTEMPVYGEKRITVQALKEL